MLTIDVSGEVRGHPRAACTCARSVRGGCSCVPQE